MSDSKVQGSGHLKVLPKNAGKTVESRHRMPSNAGKGRRKGVPNKVTADVRGMILAALDEAGGVSYLMEQARANPVAFMSLLGKLIPTKIESPPPQAPVAMSTSIAEDMRQSLKAHLAIDAAKRATANFAGGLIIDSQ